MVTWSNALHLKYGDAVRVAPDEIEFSDPAAWKDIHQARPELPKPAFGQGAVIAPNGVKPIACIVSAEDHARQRRILNHGFSERALQVGETDGFRSSFPLWEQCLQWFSPGFN